MKTAKTQALDFLKTLYPVPFPELAAGGRTPQLAIWSRSPRDRSSRTDWCPDIETAAALALKQAVTMDVYFGVALQDRDLAVALARRRKKRGPTIPAAAVRGSAKSALVLPGLWIDVDVRGDHHKSTALPPDAETALGLLSAVPHPPAIVIASGGGFHAYWPFDELWILDSEAERSEAASLSRRLQWAVRRRAQDHGWKIDNTADLARVLRLPGTLNHKRSGVAGGQPWPVEIVELTDRRYGRSHFEMLPEPSSHRANVLVPGPRSEPSAAPDSRRPDRRRHRPARLGSDAFGHRPADFEQVFQGCSWIRWCYGERHRLSEPDWYAALSVVSRCALPDADGRELAHWMSRGYPGYNAAETDAKIDHALDAAGPRSCEDIAGNLEAWNVHCRLCPHYGSIKSPIVLGRIVAGGSSSRANGAGNGNPRGRRQPPSSPPLRKGELEGDLAGGAANGGRRGGGKARKPPRQRIPLSHFENEVADRALDALVRRERNLFQRGGALVQIVAGDRRDGVPFHRPAEAPSAHSLPEPRLRELLTTHCEFVRPRAAGKKVEWRPVHPPAWIVKALLERFRWRGVQKLEGVIEGPVLRPDGTVLQTPGHDPVSGLFYAPAERFDPVPEQPSAAVIDDSLDLLRNAVCDFPFQEEAHFAGWLASLLTPLARFAFKGPSPLNLIDANVRGAGKSLLADVCHLLVTGRPAPRMAYPRDEAELRKAITTIALKARQMVLFDNVRGGFGSATLDLALTSTTWEDRLLGQNVEVELPLLVTWYVTGNNIELKGDLVRRCVHIRLESPEEKPERRSGFQHPRLLDWLEGQRRHLLPAALTLLAGYCEAGRPQQGLRPWGSYESWSDLVRGTVVWLGLPDPAVTVDGLESAADVECLAAANLVRGLGELLAEVGGAATAGEILRYLDGAKAEPQFASLCAALEELYPRLRPGDLPTTVQLGNKLRSLRGRNFGGRFVRGRKTRQGMVWSVDQE